MLFLAPSLQCFSNYRVSVPSTGHPESSYLETIMRLQEETQQRLDLAIQQFGAIDQALKTAAVGTEEFSTLATRSTRLKAEIEALEAQAIRQALAEQSTAERLAAQQALEHAQAAERLAAAQQALKEALELVVELNTASDALAAVLAETGARMPALAAAVTSAGVGGFSGGWQAILPSIASTGKIGALPYAVGSGSNWALLTRQQAGKHTG